MPKRIALLSYSPAGLFSIKGSELATSWNVLSMSGNRLSREHLMEVFSGKLRKALGSRSEVVAKVRILSTDTDGATELQLLEPAHLQP